VGEVEGESEVINFRSIDELLPVKSRAIGNVIDHNVVLEVKVDRRKF